MSSSPFLERVIPSLREWLLSKRIKPRTILAGPLRGLSIVTSWHDYPGAILGRTERSLVAWFVENVRPGETWLDVGAHYGYTALALSRLVGKTGRVFAFEPLVATAGCIAQTCELNSLSQAVVVPLGLGRTEELTGVHLTAVRGMADSTLDSGRGASSVFIQVARFDWLWRRINDGADRIDGIKIDVQGMELDVLEGMRETLARHQPKLVIELHHGVDRRVLQELLADLGYSRDGVAIEPCGARPIEQFLDDRSYVFIPA